MSREPLARRFPAFGGECEIFIAGGRGATLDSAVRWLRSQERRFTRFDPSSDLSRFNARPGSWVTVSAELEALLRLALDAWRWSDGLVHAGVLPALRAAGYTRPFRDGPTAAVLEAPQPLAPLPELLEVRPRAARLAPGAAIDLGGLAKGWLADRCLEHLGPNALVNLGGDLAAAGSGHDGEGWPVGFGDRTLLLLDEAAATSGTEERRWGDGLHHLIDPRTGLPAVTDLREVSVLAPTGAQAEILAKSALLRGRDAAERWLTGRSRAWWLA